MSDKVPVVRLFSTFCVNGRSRGALDLQPK